MSTNNQWGGPRDVKLPVRVVDGEVRFYFGNGPLPPIKDGTLGELTIPESALLESSIERVLTDYRVVPLLNKDSTLIAELKVTLQPRPVREGLHTRPINRELGFPDIAVDFAEIRLLEPLQLEIKGGKTPTLRHCHCYLPAIREEANSVNHAYTLLSEQFEVDRMSHTANVFTKVWYHDETHGWQHLNALRTSREILFQQGFDEAD